MALPRPLEVEAHPIRHVWEAFRSCFPDFELVELEEICRRSLSPVPPERMSRYVHEVDRQRILRHDLTSGLVDRWMSRGGGPCRLIAAGRAFRKGTAPQDPRTHHQVHHQAEILWAGEGLDDDVCVQTIKVAAAKVLGDVEVRLSCVHQDSVLVEARDCEARWRGSWLEFGAGGLHSSAAAEKAGLDPGRCGVISLAFGLERCALIRHDLDDIRKLWQPPYLPS